jgi:hypothetical protein
MPSRAEQLHIDRCTNAVQRHMDRAAQQWGYDDLRAACTYIGDPYPLFDAEATALRDWRSACWTTCHGVLAAALASSDPRPTVNDVLAALPAIPVRPTP